MAGKSATWKPLLGARNTETVFGLCFGGKTESAATVRSHFIAAMQLLSTRMDAELQSRMTESR